MPLRDAADGRRDVRICYVRSAGAWRDVGAGTRELKAIAGRAGTQYPATNEGWTARTADAARRVPPA